MDTLSKIGIAVLIFTLAVAMIKFGQNIHSHQVRVDTCMVKEFESNSTKDRTGKYDYCRAKARENRR